MKRKLLLVLCSVVLLVLPWLRVSGLTLLGALVPLFLLSDSYDASRRSFWRMAGWTALTFALWSVATVWWVWIAAPIGVIAATVVQVVLFGTVFMLFHYVRKRAKPTLAYVILTCGWIAAEYIYLNGQISFPWLLLGNGFANDTWAVQWYEFTGVLGGSLWVLVANILIYRAIKIRRKWIAAGIWIAVPMAVSAVMFFSWVPTSGRSVKVSVVQPVIESYTEKFVLPQETQDSIILSLAALSPEDVDFIVAPETAVDNNIWENNILMSSSVRRYREFIAQERPQAQFILGATTLRMYQSEETLSARQMSNGMWYDVYNSSLAIDATDRLDIHHKAKLVIGAEMMPFMKILKPLSTYIVDLGGVTGQLGTDNFYRVFRLERGADIVRSAAPICYESVYGEHFATFVRQGAEVMFVITNDGWWHDTPGYRQHFSYSRLRAIETRRYVARSANTGISGFITPRGDVMQSLGWNQRGILTQSLPLLNSKTLYVRYGDYLGRLGGYVFMLSALYFVVYRFRRRNHLVD